MLWKQYYQSHACCMHGRYEHCLTMLIVVKIHERIFVCYLVPNTKQTNYAASLAIHTHTHNNGGKIYIISHKARF